MTLLDQEVAWCSACSSQHESWEICPGEPELTEPERPGRRFVAGRDGKREGYQVLVARTVDCWRARIATVPNMLWRVPGGRGTAKFYAKDATEAERRAVLFLYKRCRSLEVEVTELAADLSAGMDDTLAGRRTGGQRHEHLLPALFGIDRPTWPARISNLSTTGLFLATNRPERPGQRIHVALRFQHYAIPLVGTVAWVNPRSAGEQAAGMGVELDDPPFVYRQYVASLEQRED